MTKLYQIKVREHIEEIEAESEEEQVLHSAHRAHEWSRLESQDQADGDLVEAQGTEPV